MTGVYPSPLGNSHLHPYPSVRRARHEARVLLCSRTRPAPTGRLSENVLCLPEGVWVEGLGLNYDKSKWQIGTVSGFDASVASGCTYKIDLGQECADMGLRGGVRSFNLKRVQWCLLGEDVSSAEKACTSSTTVVDHLYV